MDESIDDTFVSLGAGHGDVPTTVQAMKAGAVSTSLKLFSDIPFPLSPLDAAPPVLTTNPPVEDLIVADPDLKLPRTYQWNIAVEQSLGSSQSLSLTYVCALGRDLLRQTALNPAAGGNSNFVYVYPIDNTATSDYNALQVKFQRRLSMGLQALASYRFSHSIDISSTDAINYVTTPDAVSNPNIDREDSDFDIRHSFTAGVTYDLPAPGSDKVVHAILTQADVALQRQFHLTEQVGLRFRAEFFNILNHPNFGSPQHPDQPALRPIDPNASGLSGGWRRQRRLQILQLLKKLAD